LTSDQVTKSFGKEPLPRKLEDTNMPYPPEASSGSTKFKWLYFALAWFVTISLFFFFFSQDEATGEAHVSFVDHLLSHFLRICGINTRYLF
jgi:hypothetical protein